MSFAFNWDAFAQEEAFQAQIREMLTSALNKNKPRILEDTIKVLNLDWGAEAPALEMLEIGDMASDRFRGVFKLNYAGGASITVATKVQANLLNVYEQSAPSQFIMPTIVGAQDPFPIPLHLTLRNIRLQGTVIVVYSKSKGLTLVFRNDPLQSISVSSTFDIFPTIAGFLQQQIENQIRGLFREEVPAVLYQLSLKYLPNSSMHDASSRTKVNKDPIAFAEIDTERPVSLVNVLHIEAMLSSRKTLSLETPIMPAAIVRSELHRRALASSMQSPSLSLFSGGQALYDQLYFYARHIGSRNSVQRPPKRRVVRLRKSSEPTETSLPAGVPHQVTDEDASNASTASPSPTLSHKPQAVQRIPLAPLVRETKGLAPLLRSPQRLVFPPATHSDIWPLAVQDIDELPPAYDG